MNRAAALLVAFAAAGAFAEDDYPDLFVISGRVADGGGTPVHLKLDREVALSGGSWRAQWGSRETSVTPGGSFRFASLPPGRYDLVVDGEGVVREERPIDVFDDVSGLDVRPTRASAAPARLAGKLTLGFEGAAKDCRVTVGGVAAKIAGDGTFECAGLRAGSAWIDVVHAGARWGPDRMERYVRRRVPVELKPGDNRVEVRVEPNEDVRLALTSTIAGESVEGSIVDLDPPADDRYGDPFRVVVDRDGATHCRQIRVGGIDSSWWQDVGATLPLLGLARGTHRVKIDALGFDPVERAFTVDGPTRVDVDLTPRAGQYVVLETDALAWFVDERRTDGSWSPLFTRDLRVRPSGAPPKPRARVFLAPGVHVLRASTPDAPPSAPVELRIAGDRAEIAPTFAFAKGATLAGRLVTKAGTELKGFDVRCLRRAGDQWDHLRAQDTVARPEFTIAGLTKGRYRLAFDEEGAHVFGEFEIDAADREIEFTLRSR